MLRYFGVIFLLAGMAAMAQAQVSDADLAALRAEAKAKGWTFEIRQTSASLRSHDALSGLKLPAPSDSYWQSVPKGQSTVPKAGLPESWDWRTLDGVTAIRDQGSCGSCWAFSTMGVVESAIKIADGVELDLSEQQLLSCNTAGWGCSGAVWGYAWLIDKPDACGFVGAALEADYPYQAARLDCTCPAGGGGTVPRLYRISSFSYVNGLQPTVPQIKQALMDHGPLGCSLYTNAAFSAYGGGVFNADDHPTVFNIDHALVLVGWDDRLGTSGAWIIKNSWGTDWGENGFGYIEYGCNLIGYAANYVVYNGTQSGIQVTPLTGLTSTGPVGGPFTPPSAAYTVTNTGAIDLHWQALAPSWCDVNPQDGTLAPNESASVTAMINTSLTGGGSYGGDLVIRNALTGQDQHRWISLTIPKPTIYSFNLDTDPGWSITGLWAYGPPQGYSGPHGADPASACTGTNIYGYNLAGYYTDNMSPQYLTTSALDFTNWQDVELRFQRWLGIESSSYDHASIEVSRDGASWTPVWTYEGASLSESAWHEQVYSIASVADRQPTVYVRWVMGPTDTSVTYAGWNIDDIEFRANPKAGEGEGEGEGEGPQPCVIDSPSNIFTMLLMIADSNGDGVLSQAEASVFVPDIASFWSLFDLDQDGTLDRNEFVTSPLVQGFLPAVDSNHDNIITLSELQALTYLITPDMFALVDKDSSGGIDCGDLGFVVEPPCPECAPTAGALFARGMDACLEVPGGSMPETSYQWAKQGLGALAEGRYVGVHCANLFIPNLDVEDSGTYTCQYGPQNLTYSITIQVVPQLASSGPLVLIALVFMLVCAALLQLRGIIPGEAL